MNHKKIRNQKFEHEERGCFGDVNFPSHDLAGVLLQNSSLLLYFSALLPGNALLRSEWAPLGASSWNGMGRSVPAAGVWVQQWGHRGMGAIGGWVGGLQLRGLAKV